MARATKRTVPNPDGGDDNGAGVEAPPTPTKAAGAADTAAPAAPARRRRARIAPSTMEEATPDVGRNRQQETPTRVPPSPPFWLVFDPNRWDVVGGCVVPQLYKLTARPGANGVAFDERTKRVLPSAALAQVEERGHYVLPHNIDGPRTSYLRRERVTGGWFTRFERVYPGTDAIESDETSYGQWLVSLIERDLLPPCPPYVLDRLMEQYSKRLGMMRGANAEAYRVQIERHEHAVEVIQAEMERALLEGRDDAVDNDNPAELEQGELDEIDMRKIEPEVRE